MARRDALIALGLLAAGQIEVWVFWAEDEQGPRPLAAVALALMAATLAWRRRAPLAVVGIVSALYLAWSVADPPRGSIVPFLILLAAVLTVARDTPLRPAASGGLVGLAAIWSEFALTDNDLANYGFTGVIAAGAWAGGRALRRGAERARELEAHAIRLDRARETEARAAVAEERTRIARELHDVVAHNVSLMVIQSQAAQATPDTPDTAGALRRIERTGQETLVEMRRLLGLLRSEDEELALAPQPSVRHLDRLAESVRRAGLPVELDVEQPLPPLPPGVDVSAYRIVQEALTNALRHAGPARARVVVRCRDGEIELEVSDDGTGAAGAGGGGHGLVGMRERVKVYGGDLATGVRPEGGYSVRVRLPYDGAAR